MTCPCGGIHAVTCEICGRTLCWWHFAIGFFYSLGRTHQRPVCLPKCGEQWWSTLKKETAS